RRPEEHFQSVPARVLRPLQPERRPAAGKVPLMRAWAATGAALVLLAAAACPGDSRGSGRYVIRVDTTNVPEFSGRNAHALLVRQTQFGPRVAGRTGHKLQLDWMSRYLLDRADTLFHQNFE